MNYNLSDTDINIEKCNSIHVNIYNISCYLKMLQKELHFPV